MLQDAHNQYRALIRNYVIQRKLTYLQAVREALKFEYLSKLPDDAIGHIEQINTGDSRTFLAAFHYAPGLNVAYGVEISVGGNIGDGIYLTKPSFYVLKSDFGSASTLVCLETNTSQVINVDDLTKLIDQLISEYDACDIVRSILYALNGSEPSKWNTARGLTTYLAESPQRVGNQIREIVLTL